VVVDPVSSDASHRNVAAEALWDWPADEAPPRLRVLDDEAEAEHRRGAHGPMRSPPGPDFPGPLATVRRVPSRRSSGDARLEHRLRLRARKRARRTAGALILAVVLLVTLLMTAFGSGRQDVIRTKAPAPAGRLLPVGPPSPQVIAARGSVRIQLPIPQERVTAIGYHRAGPGTLQFTPFGTKANRGFVARTWDRVFGGGDSGGGLRYYELGGGSGAADTALDVGAAAGTDVYSPVDGTVIGISDYVINGRKYGVRLDLEPLSNSSAVVSLTQIAPDRALSVGSTVAAGTSKIGSVVDLSGIEKQALARYTQDAGNHVSIEVHPAATLSIP